MSMQSEGKDAQGRNYDQVTKDGTGSIGSVGAGGTGDIGRMSGQSAEQGSGNQQQGGRTDDLLSSDAETDVASDGFVGEEAGELQTGMGGIGSLSTGNAGSRQSEGEREPGGDKGAMNAGSADGARAPESGGQRTRT